MGRKARRVLAVVAAIAIPYVAPAIASSIGLSSAIGAAAANTITGAVLGAGVAKATGGNVLLGAVGGGAGGYFGGGGGDLFAGGTPTTTNVTGGVGPVDYGITGAPSTGGITPTVAPSTTPIATPMTVPVTGVDYSLAGGMTPAGTIGVDALGTGLSPTAVGTGFQTPYAYDIGAALSTSAPIDYSLAAGTPTSAATMAASPAMAAAGGVPTAGVSVPTTSAVTGTPQITTGAGTSVLPTAAPVTGGGAAAAPTTFVDALKRVPSEIANKFKDPKVLADMTLRGAAMLAGGAMADTGLSPEEQQLLQYQMDDLEWLRQNNPEAYEMRLQEAQKLLGMSDYFDPEYFGLQSARAAQIRGARSKRAGLRGLTGQARAVAERQLDIATGRETGTAFDIGAQRATTGRIQTQQAGLQLMPSPSSYTTPYSDIRQAYSAADARRRQTASDIGGLFGSVTGPSQARLMG